MWSKIYFFTFLTLSISFGLHFFLFKALVHFFRITDSNWKTLIFVILTILSICLIASVFAVRLWKGTFSSAFYVFAAVWLAFLANLTLGAGILYVFGPILTLVKGFYGAKIVAVAIFSLAIVYSLYGIVNAFNPRVKNVIVRINHLPDEWKDKKAVQISDIHLGLIHGAGFLNKVVTKVNALEPEVIFITGDLFDGMDGDLSRFVEPLNTLSAHKGIFFVTGNHEFYIGLQKALETLGKTKIKVLQNELVEVQGLQIIGVSYPGIESLEDIRGLDYPSENPGNPKPRILLFHTPTNILRTGSARTNPRLKTYWGPDTSFPADKLLGISLQLSGHTHRGQIFPFNYVARLIFHGFEYGLKEKDGLSIYTSSGVGTWGPPMRTATSPEIVVITLR